MGKRLNLELHQGADFSYSVVLEDDETDLVLDLSTYSANAVMRKHHESNSYFQFQTTLNANGEVLLEMNSTTSAQVSSGDWLYMVTLVDADGKKSKPLEGRVRVRPTL